MSPDSTGPLSLMTYAELRDAALAKFATASNETRKAGWVKLAEIIGAHLGKDGREDVDETWRISRIEVAGFRGTSPALDKRLIVNLPPVAGLTVIHGENGSGKSSIAHALTAALHPTYRPSERATRSTVGDDPWEACDVHTDADEARVTVVLRADNGDQLKVTAAISPGTDPERSIVRGGESGGSTSFSRDWNEAFAIHRPVFAYAEQRQSINTAADLKEFLLGHLLLGGCFENLRRETESSFNEKKQARDTTDKAWELLENTLESIAGKYPDIAATLPSPGRPTDDQTSAEWLTGSGFVSDASDQSAPVLTIEDFNAVREAADEAFAKVGSYLDEASSAWGPLESALRALADHAKHFSKLPDECPVCDSKSDWRTHLEHRLQELEHLSKPHARATKALKQLQTRLDVVRAISAILGLADAGRPDATWAAEFQSTLIECEALRSGQPHQPQVLVTLDRVHNAMHDPRFEPLAERLVEHSQELQQWNRERSRAACTFADVWWEHRDTAREFALWSAVRKSIEELQSSFRERREEQLRTILAQTCGRLLGDANLTLDALGITKKTAAPTFAATEQGAQPRPLGVLSAGQQNAFLLAPIVGPRSTRPFGFVVFDDPVHALDELRIDELAGLIRERAKTHQVILFTHDERLTESLRNSAPRTRIFTISRDTVSSTITLEPDQPLWKRLIDASEGALNAGNGAKIVGPGVARSLMRQAVDAAIRDALLAHICNQDGADWTKHLASLNERNTTNDRLIQLEQSYPNTTLAERGGRARGYVAAHLPTWNAATHRDPEVEKFVVNAERSAARKACEALTKPHEADDE